MNRAARRARPAKVPMVKLGLLTIPEAELMAEWADGYLLQLEELLGDDEPTPPQVWARDRTRQLRDMLQAAVDGRPALDEHARREEPA